MSHPALGSIPPKNLVAARLQAHYASQIVSGVARTLLEKRDDDSHTNLGWVEESAALAGRRVEGERPFAAALDVASLSIRLVDGRGQTVTDIPLGGRTLDEGYERLAAAIAEYRGEALEAGFTPLHYEMPADPIGEGAPFAAGGLEALETLSGWFSFADRLLNEQRERNDGASTVRCWPHHFDIATSIDLGDGKSIGVGWSPGDGSYPEPYFYVSPWPYPDSAALPEAPAGGRWHTAGFTSLILTGSALVGSSADDAQEQRAREFLADAVGMCRRLLA